MQVTNRELGGNRLAPALQLDLHLPPHCGVERFGEGLELRDVAPVQAHEDIAGLQYVVTRRAGQHACHHQHARVLRKRLAHRCFGGTRQPETLQLVVGRVIENGVQRAARHRLALLDELQRASHPSQRQIEARGCAVRAPGIEADDPPADVDDGRARGATRCARGGLQVKGVEVVVFRDPVLGGVAIEPRQCSREDRQLLTGVVADDADLAPDLRALRVERQGPRLDKTQLARIVAVQAEVMHRIAVHGVELHFLAVEEGRLGGHGPGRDDMAVGQDEAALGVDHEPRSLRGRVPLRIERPRRIDIDRYDAAGDTLKRDGPVGVLLDGRRLLGDLRGLLSAARERAWGRLHRQRFRGTRLHRRGLRRSRLLHGRGRRRDRRIAPRAQRRIGPEQT